MKGAAKWTRTRETCTRGAAQVGAQNRMGHTVYVSDMVDRIGFAYETVNPFYKRWKLILKSYQKAPEHIWSSENRLARTSNITNWNWHTARAPTSNFMFVRCEHNGKVRTLAGMGLCYVTALCTDVTLLQLVYLSTLVHNGITLQC